MVKFGHGTSWTDYVLVQNIKRTKSFQGMSGKPKMVFECASAAFGNQDPAYLIKKVCVCKAPVTRAPTPAPAPWIKPEMPGMKCKQVMGGYNPRTPAAAQSLCAKGNCAGVQTGCGKLHEKFTLCTGGYTGYSFAKNFVSNGNAQRSNPRCIRPYTPPGGH